MSNESTLSFSGASYSKVSTVRKMEAWYIHNKSNAVRYKSRFGR